MKRRTLIRVKPTRLLCKSATPRFGALAGTKYWCSATNEDVEPFCGKCSFFLYASLYPECTKLDYERKE